MGILVLAVLLTAGPPVWRASRAFYDTVQKPSLVASDAQASTSYVVAADRPLEFRLSGHADLVRLRTHALLPAAARTARRTDGRLHAGYRDPGQRRQSAASREPAYPQHCRPLSRCRHGRAVRRQPGRRLEVCRRRRQSHTAQPGGLAGRRGGAGAPGRSRCADFGSRHPRLRTRGHSRALDRTDSGSA